MSATYYPVSDQGLNIARGLVKGVSSVHKFGAVPSMSTATTGTVWDVDDTLYPWAAFGTANVAVVSANAANDDGKNVIVEGLDSNLNFQTETLTISSGAATGVKLFKRLHRAQMGDGNSNNVVIKVNANTVATILAGKGQTLMAVYTVANSCTGYLTNIESTAEAGKDATILVYVRDPESDTFRIKHTFEISGDGGPYQKTWAVPRDYPAGSDIDIRATTRSNNGRYAVSFCVDLITDGLGGHQG